MGPGLRPGQVERKLDGLRSREAAEMLSPVLFDPQTLGSIAELVHNAYMGIKATIESINRMQADGIIGKYAIGGAVGATFYLEPAATLDVDVFVIVPTKAGGPLLSLSPIYDYLKAQGATIEDEHIVIGGWPVQFLPASDDLELEALAQAVATTIEDVGTWVMTAEHLAAIALRTGRSKDHNRILQFLEQGAVDRKKLSLIIDRHNLAGKWKQFEHRFLEGMHG